MNRTTNLFVLLIVISFIFPATAIRYAQAASTTRAESTENNANMTGESMENNTTSPANMTENNANMTGESMENNTTSPANMTENNANMTENPGLEPSGSTENTTSGMESNNTANARQESNRYWKCHINWCS